MSASPPPLSRLPRHIAIIMDGNGRWAKQRFLPRLAGHKAGVEAARLVVKQCVKQQIAVLTLFAFSSENWRRPPEEIDHLMGLFLTGLEREAKMLHDNQIQLRFIGSRTRLSDELCKKIQEAEKLTHANTGMVLQIAVDYGGQWDIYQAMRQLAQEVEEGKLSSSAVTPELIASKLSFADLPDPDLFIRTSGEIRISNFILWQLAYAELYFTDTFWPDFNEIEFEKALTYFAGRDRRYGLAS
ncbi:MAG TPA: isoprenyl transferase [Gammaproteobacteria bacterium]|jgi:undecaprenyl diphosphate synthase|nr:isoprenyl transferase [Gammaproteobacteria bacterium]